MVKVLHQLGGFLALLPLPPHHQSSHWAKTHALLLSLSIHWIFFMVEVPDWLQVCCVVIMQHITSFDTGLHDHVLMPEKTSGVSWCFQGTYHLPKNLQINTQTSTKYKQPGAFRAPGGLEQLPTWWSSLAQDFTFNDNRLELLICSNPWYFAFAFCLFFLAKFIKYWMLQSRAAQFIATELKYGQV